MRILVTGGAGFIGSNFVHYMLQRHSEDQIVVLDKLTYAGNLNNLKTVMKKIKFIKGDICDRKLVEKVAREVDVIINFAAETHVDRSISEPEPFVRTNVLGTQVLLEAARKFDHERFVQISTDEVYGSIRKGSFKEEDPLRPSSPYAATKAAADMLVRSYFVTYGLPVLITRSTNNFGPYQHPEKLIPKLIINAILGKPLPIYGDGKNVRDWLYVADNCEAIDLVLRKGKNGEIYNIGGGNEKMNIEIAEFILEKLGKPKSMIKFIKDRPGHDLRYSLNCEKIKELGWKPRHNFEKALEETIYWYKNNDWWWQ
ncbi:MAG: dTDP-glucose 4,6-dehydratase [Candidatus Hadarchaeales archaeon]